MGLLLVAAVILSNTPFSSCAENTAPAAGKEAGPAKAEPFEPKVVLSEHHRALCKVLVGDPFPDGTATDLQGKSQTISALFGKKLTVVVFWNQSNPYAVEEFCHLQGDILKPFAGSGVAVIAIHVGPKTDKVQQLCEQFGQAFPCLIDADKSLLHKVATSKLPRTYLLDAKGKILWFDIEYSRTTRFDLNNALRWYLRPVGKTAAKE